MRQHFWGFPFLKQKDSLCNASHCTFNHRMLEKTIRSPTTHAFHESIPLPWSPYLFVSSCDSLKDLKSFSPFLLGFGNWLYLQRHRETYSNIQEKNQHINKSNNTSNVFYVNVMFSIIPFITDNLAVFLINQLFVWSTKCKKIVKKKKKDFFFSFFF